MPIHSPSSEAEAAEIVSAARAARTALRIVGGGTRQDLGRPVNATARLSTEKLGGITLYEPAEMVIGARAGTPLDEVVATLAAKGQMLPFEPMDHRPLLGSTGAPTMGAIAAGNISGPRRISHGAARDSLIGVRFVNGRGEIVKSGGRVMKNVTGLDVVKLQSGAWGTLGFLTEVIFKVLPAPETQRTLVLEGLDDARGIAALSAGLTSPFEVTGAAHLPATDTAAARTMLRIEGFEASLTYRAAALGRLLTPFGAARILEESASASLWRMVRDAEPLLEPRDAAVWRLSVKPSDGPKVHETVAHRIAGHIQIVRPRYLDSGIADP
ncbi:MAG TPA: FAD-binding protein, partial [Beijerinckiaceae bacterium]|nr:FAD-binding protein [Beijerinckiaceae bacterium]